MEKCRTTREQFYHNDAVGDLLFETDDVSTVERVDDMLVIKVIISKGDNWQQAADFLFCEVSLIAKWGFSLMRKGVKEWKDIEPIERYQADEKADADVVAEDDDDFDAMRDPQLYMYFYDDTNWVMYENDRQYLLLYELHSHDYALSTNDIDALAFNPKDEVVGMCEFMRGWYERVNGVLCL